VLNDDPTVSTRPETRERVLTAARELNYRPNAFGRGLKLQTTSTLGMVIPNLAYPVNADIIRGAEQAAMSAGYVMLLVDADEFVRAGEAYKRLLLEQRVDGLLIASGGTQEPVLEDLARHGLPFVLVNRRVSGIGPCVTVDDNRGMQLAVDYLIGLGHTRIALIGGPADADTARRRLAGYRTAMKRAGLPIPRGYVVESAYEEARGYDAMEKLLALSSAPTAVAVWSLAAAAGALAAAHAHGVDIPGRLSMVGFHDAPIAAYLAPALTTVAMPLREMAERSVDTLIRLIAGERIGSTVIKTAPRLVERASSGPPP